MRAIEKLIGLAGEAMRAAEICRAPWQEVVRLHLSSEGFTVLDPEACGVGRIDDLVVVVELGGVAHLLRRNSEFVGGWRCTPWEVRMG